VQWVSMMYALVRVPEILTLGLVNCVIDHV
jgi:hypothetical protein